MNKSIRMSNNGSDMLDEILQVGKGAGNMTSIGFNHQSPNKKEKTHVAKSFHSQRKCDVPMSDQMLSHPTSHQKPAHKEKFTAWKCHYCGKNGHIKPFCYKLYGYPKKKPQAKKHHVKTKPKKEWKPKDIVSNPLSFPTKVVVDSVAGSPKETSHEIDVVRDVSTSVAQPGQYVEAIQENPHIEFQCVSTSEDITTQSKMVTNNSEEEKTSIDESKNSASKFASCGEDQSLSKSEKGEFSGKEDDASEDGQCVSEKDESSLGKIIYTVGTQA
ncbi:gag-pol polyprotein [Trifolium medium]|uniref:Gag-pol polyprotein n=1 Tax=Trifolium medium TaxID=97028 RepID=A0A392M6V0_9FABA|nr:gag-pol polyprotein [Trifolium medium]